MKLRGRAVKQEQSLPGLVAAMRDVAESIQNMCHHRLLLRYCLGPVSDESSLAVLPF